MSHLSIPGGEATCPRCDAPPGELCRGIAPSTHNGRKVVSHSSHGERLFAASGRWEDMKRLYGRLADA